VTQRLQPMIDSRADYACRALLSIALHPEDQPVSARRIAERTGMPVAYLKQVMLGAKASGLICTTRGVQGGYELALPPELITLAHITRSASEAGSRRLRRRHRSGQAHNWREGEIVGAVWDELDHRIERYLRTVTLAELVAAAQGTTAPALQRHLERRDGAGVPSLAIR
jgi:Rrf2 family protein